MTPEARANRARGHRYQWQVLDVHVEVESHRDDLTGSVLKRYRNLGDYPAQLAEESRDEARNGRADLFAAFDADSSRRVCLFQRAFSRHQTWLAGRSK